MNTLQNDTLIRALARQPTPYTPVWLMRQAGRYLPEYNDARRRAGSFLALCKTPSLATEVTLQPLERFRLDAAILFSDILTIPDAMGLGLYFADGEGPRFERPLRDEASIAKLAAPDPAEDLRYVGDAVAQIRRALAGRVPLIGFAGSPYTLACYMVEGGASEDWRTVKVMLYRRPDLLHRLLETNSRAVSALLNAQIEAGAQIAMIFDTWGGSLPAAAYREFSLAYIERVLSQLNRGEGGARVPVIVFTKGGAPGLEPGSRRCAPTGRRARRPARQSRSDGAARLTGVGAARNREGARILWKRGRPCVQSRSRRSAARAARKRRGAGRCSARIEPKIPSVGLKSGISGAGPAK